MIKTHDSESQGQAVRDERVSYLHVTPLWNLLMLKISRHESYCLAIIKNSAHSNHVESVTQQWKKSVPPIQSTSHCEFNGARSCAHS